MVRHSVSSILCITPRIWPSSAMKMMVYSFLHHPISSEAWRSLVAHSRANSRGPNSTNMCSIHMYSATTRHSEAICIKIDMEQKKISCTLEQIGSLRHIMNHSFQWKTRKVKARGRLRYLMISSLVAIFPSVMRCTILWWSSSLIDSRDTSGVRIIGAILTSPHRIHECFRIESRLARSLGSRRNNWEIKLKRKTLTITQLAS